MKTIFVFLVILITLNSNSFGQPVKNYIQGDSRLDEPKNLNWIGEDILFYRFQKQNFSNDTIYCIIDSTDNSVLHKFFFSKLNGLWVTENYYQGKLVQRYLSKRENGQLNCLQEEAWYLNGNLYREFNWDLFFKMKLQKVKYFYPNGSLEREFTTIANAHVGQDISYYKSGIIKEILNYKYIEVDSIHEPGLLDGVSLYFNEEGKLIETKYYLENILLRTVVSTD